MATAQIVANRGAYTTPNDNFVRPIVVGLYGLPGSGKSTLLRNLTQELDSHHFMLCEGSEQIAKVCPGGLDAFKALSVTDKTTYREKAIQSVQQECLVNGRSAVLAGHFMFRFNESEVQSSEVWTSADANVFTHIIYLDTAATDIERQCSEDLQRTDREPLPAATLEIWKRAEKDRLRSICYDNAILFSIAQRSGPAVVEEVVQLLRDFLSHDESYNHNNLIATVDEIVNTSYNTTQAMLLLDADKTLAPIDSGNLFWRGFSNFGDEPLQRLFGSLGYSYHSFRQAMLLYQGFGDAATYDRRCVEVAEKIKIYAEFLHLIRSVAKDRSIGVAVLTCGVSRIWSLVLEREGLSDTVRVIGSGRLENKFIVTPQDKYEVVTRLQQKYNLYVWAFGDSPLDLPMLQKADEAIIVVGKEGIRSRSMDEFLEKAITEHGIRARQVLLPADELVSPRLSTDMLPVVELERFVATEVSRSARGMLDITHATNKTSSKILARDMRDANVSGHALREAHGEAGWYLATEYISEMIGLEQVQTPHVSGGYTLGHRLLHEERTSIVACMRGGEAMALGVSKAFPLARFIHASKANDLESHHLNGQSRVILVDSVINEGNTIVKFVKRIRQLHRFIRIIVVAGVAQAASVSDDGLIAQNLEFMGKVSIVALRISKNKYTGSGGTDTGNRLFNTVYQVKQERQVLVRSIS